MINKSQIPKVEIKENTPLEQNEFLHKKAFKQGKYKNQTNVNTIQNKIETYNNKIENYKNVLQNLDNEFKEKEKELKILQERQRVKQKKNSTVRFKSIMNNQKKLENDLDKKQKIISNFKSKNEFLRRQIDDHRKEKNIYKNISDQVLKEIDDVKKSIDKNDQKLELLYSQKLQIEEKIQKQDKQSELENQLTTLGYLTMKKKLLNHSSQKNFQTKKQMIEQVQQKDNDIKPKKDSTYDIFITQNQSSTPNKKKSKKSTIVPNKITYIQEQQDLEEEFKKEEQQLKGQLKEMENLFEKLYKETQTDNIDDLISYYTQLEEKNLNYYKETQQMIEEIDKAKDRKLEMQMELKNIINSKEKEQTIKDKIMKEMKHDYEKSNKQLQDILQQKNDLKKTVNTLKLSIQVILDRLSFNKNEAEDENKHPDHIIENKEVPEYLFKLEKKTNKILKLVKENNLQSRIFDDPEVKPYKNLDENKQVKQFINNIEEIKKMHQLEKTEDDNHSMMSVSELRKSVYKDVDKFFKRNEKKQFDFNLCYFQYVKYFIQLSKIQFQKF